MALDTYVPRFAQVINKICRSIDFLMLIICRVHSYVHMQECICEITMDSEFPVFTEDRDVPLLVLLDI